VRIPRGSDYGFAWNPVGRNARDLEYSAQDVKLLQDADDGSPRRQHCRGI